MIIPENFEYFTGVLKISSSKTIIIVFSSLFTDLFALLFVAKAIL